MITLTNLSKQFGARVLFDSITAPINPAVRTALIGPNGAGKSFLLKVIMGKERPDAGTVSVPGGLSIGYLPQELEVDTSTTPLELVLAPFARLLDGDPGTAGEHDALEHERFVTDAWSLPARARALLSGLGVAQGTWERCVGELSGGYRMRVVLAGLLLQAPDLLLLDEPTNHLDFDSVLWLERFMGRFAGGVVIVSHDRAFLRRLTTHTAELAGGVLTLYDGPLDRFYQWKQERDEQIRHRHQVLSEQIEKNEAFVRRFKAKATKAAQARSREKQAQRLREQLPVVRTSPFRHVRMTLPPPPPCGAIAFKMEGVSAGYGETMVLESLDLTVRRGEHIAVVGPNGSGKSTLLKICAGVLPVRSGSVATGHNARVRYYSQHRLEQLDPRLSAFEEVAAVAPTSSPTFIQTLLGGFLFSGDESAKRVEVLSGGEKSRLSLATVFADPGNILLLDEPTNHLDIETVDWLADALARFEGTTLTVSHDEDFIEQTGGRILDMREGRVRSFEGSLSQYRSHIESGYLAPLDDVPKGAEPASRSPRPPPAGTVPTKHERIAQREAKTRSERHLAKVEKAISRVEEEIAAARAVLEDPANGSNFELLGRVARQQREHEVEHAHLMKEWEELAVELER